MYKDIVFFGGGFHRRCKPISYVKVGSILYGGNCQPKADRYCIKGETHDYASNMFSWQTFVALAYH